MARLNERFVEIRASEPAKRLVRRDLTYCNSINPRSTVDGGGKPIDYAALMRIGTAAQAGGDLATAVGVFRRAASIEPLLAAPFVAAANALLEMGEVNEAIVTYQAALVRSDHDPEALRGLA